MGFVPASADADVHFERNFQGVATGRDHGRACGLADPLYCRFGNFEHELVVNLHDQFRRSARFITTPTIDRNHGELDEIGRGPLHRCIDGTAFGVLLHRAISRTDIGQIQAAAKYGFDIAEFASLLASAIHIGLHTRVAGEVQIDVALC